MFKPKPSPKTHQERTTDILEILPRFSHLPGFPKTAVALQATATTLAGFIETAKNGAERPLDWVAERMFNTCERFPAPIRWRQIYEDRYLPLDGETASALLSVIEG